MTKVISAAPDIIAVARVSHSQQFQGEWDIRLGFDLEADPSGAREYVMWPYSATGEKRARGLSPDGNVQ